MGSTQSAMREKLLDAHTAAIRDYNAYAVLLQDAIARSVGLNAVDLQAVGVLMADGPSSPGELAASIGLSSGGAITALIDRLEKAGYISRQRDEVDRRRVVIQVDVVRVLTDVGPVYASIADDWGRYLETLSDDDLGVVTAAFTAATEVNRSQISSLRSGDAHRRPSTT